MNSPIRAIVFAMLAALGAALTAVGWGQVQPAAERVVFVLHIDGMIGPASADFVIRGLAQAQARGARLVVLHMDTPGGLDTSMRAIIKEMLASPVPVAVFVAPEGARAASAGTYILYASHLAAMAPATNLGAATPVSIGGPPGGIDKPAKPAEKDAKDAGESKGGPRDAMTEKAVNDAAAYLKSLAQLRGRNAEFAEDAVRKASSLSAEDALKGGVIDLIAPDVAELLRRADGREVALGSGKVKLELAGATTLTLKPDWRTKLLALLSNPTIAVVLMMIGIYGLFVEFTSPGYTVPGVGGAIALLLALYAFHLLPVNWAGVALMLLGAALMIAEVFLPSFGVIGVGGIVAFIVGGLLVMDTDAPGFGIPLTVVVATALVGSAAIFIVGSFALRARRRPVVSGQEELLGACGTVDTVESGETWAMLRGERWRIHAAGALAVGERVRVTAVRGLTLEVERDAGN